MLKRITTGVLTLVLLGWGASAQAVEPIRVSLTGQAETEVANDEAIITLEVAREGKDQEQLRHDVDAVASRLVEALRKLPDLTVQTIGRSTYPIHRNTTVVGWSVHQTFRITDRKVDDLSWTGRVERMGGTVQGVSFRVSDEALRQAKRGLLDQAAEDFRAQAAKVATLFGTGKYAVESLALDGNNLPRPRPMSMEMMARGAMAEDGGGPPMEGGRSTVHLRLSGVVLIAPAP